MLGLDAGIISIRQLPPLKGGCAVLPQPTPTQSAMWFMASDLHSYGGFVRMWVRTLDKTVVLVSLSKTLDQTYGQFVRMWVRTLDKTVVLVSLSKTLDQTYGRFVRMWVRTLDKSMAPVSLSKSP